MRKYINLISEAIIPKNLGRESPLKGTDRALYAIGKSMSEPSADEMRRLEIERKKRDKARVQKGKATKAANAAANAGKEPTVYRFGHFRIPIADMDAYEQTKDPAIAERAIKLSLADQHPGVLNMLKNNDRWQAILRLIMSNAIQKKNTGHSRFDSARLESEYHNIIANVRSGYFSNVRSSYDRHEKQ